ncbi:MAG TPA: DUF362 domain-containing protein [Dehalococcoidia bacterium]|nr:DUF362 domain-containing protein [Dehalococcoidia bacterium]
MQTLAQPQEHAASRRTAGRVAVLYTSAHTVLPDIARLMELAGVREALDPAAPTALKVNISWQRYYPACSTSPWQLDGTIRGLRRAGFRDLVAVQNGTVVVDSHEGERRNKHLGVLRRHGVPSVHVTDPGTKRVRYAPKAELLALDRIFPDGIEIPEVLFGKNVVHLPTLKTHVFTTITGAMKNGFGGLLDNNRHWAHAQIHETLVDLLTIQQEIHAGLFAVMDGTIAGDGPGPRAMRPHVKNLLIAGGDLVAVDAVSAKLQGFDPLSLPFIRLAHERGLGVGDPARIEVAGIDISGIDFGFSRSEDTFASRGQKLIYWGPLKRFEHVLLRSRIAPWSFVASNLYHNAFWYPFVGRRRAAQMRDTEWGCLFRRYR